MKIIQNLEGNICRQESVDDVIGGDGSDLLRRRPISPYRSVRFRSLLHTRLFFRRGKILCNTPF